MSKTKSFLDFDGLVYLWSKINMQDYPNNDTLVNIINAIDDTKADIEYVNNHINNQEVHLQVGERDSWNQKQNQIIGNPNEYVIIDENGMVTTRSAKSLIIIDSITNQPYSLSIQNGQIITVALTGGTSLLGEGLLGDFILGE